MGCSRSLTIKPSELDEVFLLAPHLRQADREEVEAAGGTSITALADGVLFSEECYSVYAEGKIIGMFGIFSQGMPKGLKTIWFLGSDESENYPFAFVREGKRLINKVLKDSSVLNTVYSKNETHIKYLERIGLVVDKENPITYNNHIFYRFYKLRN